MFQLLKRNLFNTNSYKVFAVCHLNKWSLGNLKKISLILVCFLFLFLGNQAYAIKGKLIKTNFKIVNKLGGGVKIKTNPYGTAKTVLRQPQIIISKDTGVISSCVGFASVNPNLQQFNVSGIGLIENIEIIAPNGFDISLSPDGNFTKNLILPLAADSVRDTTVYVRSDASAKIGINIDSVKVNSSEIIQNAVVSSTVYALPVVNNLSNIVVNNGDTVKALRFGGTGTSYDWTSDNPNIGLTNAGGANLPTFKAINNTNAPITATITVKPRFSLPGFIYFTNSIDSTITKLSGIKPYNNLKVGNIPNYNNFTLDTKGNKGYFISHNYEDINLIDLYNYTQSTIIKGGITNYLFGPMCINADATRAYVCHNTYGTYVNNLLSVYNLTDGSKIKDFSLGDYSIQGLTISPDGKNLYAIIDSAYDSPLNPEVNFGFLLIINPLNNEITNRIPVGAIPYSIQVSPDNSTIYVANYFSDYISVINATTGKEINQFKVGNGYAEIVLSPDGGKLYTITSGTQGGILKVINNKVNQVIANLQLDVNKPSYLKISPDGNLIYFIDFDTNDVIVIDANSLNVVSTIKNVLKKYSQISFITSSNYYGTPTTFTITVNPTIPILAASSVSGNITACEGAASTSPNIAQFTVSGHLLNDNVVVNAPSGFEVSLSQASGYSNTLTLIKTADSVTSTTIYVRSSSSAPAGSLNTIILISSSGAKSISVPVIATINSVFNPTINISSSENNICSGTAITFNALITNGGSSPSYQWLLNGNVVGSNTPNFVSSTLADGDMITCKLTSNATCVLKQVVISNAITIKVGAIPTVNAGGNKIIKRGYSTVLNASATGDIVDITWSPTEGLSNYKILNPTASPYTTTKYTLKVLTSFGCSAEGSATITVFSTVSIPNAFSPNNDGINDTWNIKDIEGYPNCTVDIFNRYGTKVYSSRGYGMAWDGRYNNADLPVGTYYYIINLNDGSKAISGYVTLIR